MKEDYKSFLDQKSQYNKDYGFDPIFMPDYLFDFQKYLVDWSVKKGRAAIFADCGLGKTVMQLVFAENAIRKTNGKALIVTPLAVGRQTLREAEKFGIEAYRSTDGIAKKNITITNYEKLHLFNPDDYEVVVCDESSILKNFDGKRKNLVTQFIKKKKYRLLCTATAAPNDHIELGTSSEALGYMGYMDMLNRFFKNDQNTCDTRRKWLQNGGMAPKFRFKKHAETEFWRWVCTWARAVRKPSDIGFNDDGFILPKLIERETIIEHSRPLNGRLFPETATSLKEQREERRYTLNQRCEKVSELVDHDDLVVVWCQLNDEGDYLEKIIPEAKQVKGTGMTDERKEELFNAFSDGEIRVLITKPKIGAFGLNWQHCSHTTFFPSHSYEQYYQGVRRFLRFGQKINVTVDIVTTQGEVSVLKNLQRKAQAADQMFDSLTRSVNDAIKIDHSQHFTKKEIIPSWLA